MTEQGDDPLLLNAGNDLDSVVKRLGATIAAQQAAGTHTGPSYLDVLRQFGPRVLEAVLIEAIKLAGLPLPPPL